MDQDNEDMQAARRRLREVLPHLREALDVELKRSLPGATAELAVVVKNPDGSGRVGASFCCDEFLADLALVSGEALLSKEEQEEAALEAKAEHLLQTLGLK